VPRPSRSGNPAAGRSPARSRSRSEGPRARTSDPRPAEERGGGGAFGKSGKKAGKANGAKADRREAERKGAGKKESGGVETVRNAGKGRNPKPSVATKESRHGGDKGSRVTTSRVSRPQRNAAPPDGEIIPRLLRLLGKEPLPLPAIAAALGAGPDIADLLSRLEREGRVVRVRRDHYVLPETADLFTGRLQIHAGGSGHVLAEEEGGKDLFISPENLGTALNGDRVVARLLRQARNHGRPRREVRAEGRIIRVVERAGTPIVGTLQKTRNFLHVVADDPRFPRNLYVPSAEGAKPGDKVVARLEAWENSHVNPEGRVVEVLGPAGAPGVDMLAVIRKHNLPREFPPAVLIEAERFGAEVTDRDLEGREDLRERPVITIDPDDARDFDDAVEVQPHSSGEGWEVSVHIADVSHYVKPGSPLDKEARKRGNSVYLADRVIPMLPENLSNGLCSLRPHEDRLAFTVFASIARDGAVRKVRFARTVIRSSARLTYREALALLGKPPADEVSRRVHEAWACSAVLRKRRFSAGALDLEMPEVKVWLDKEGSPVKLELVENDISHQLIEELMLLANEQVARHLKRRQRPNVYRIHEKPDPEKLDEYRELAATYGVRAGDLTHRPELQKLLDGLKGKPYAAALRIGLLKSLKRARYAPDPVGHFGLSKSDYSHFTSPIRRYADLLTHRSLAKDLNPSEHGPSSGELTDICEHISTTERAAADAEKESVRMKKLEYFSRLAAEVNGIVPSFQARVVEARNYGLLVELPESLMTGLVPASSMGDDFYIFDATRARLIGRNSRKVHKAGDELRVEVARVDTFKQQIDFRIASARKPKLVW